MVYTRTSWLNLNFFLIFFLKTNIVFNGKKDWMTILIEGVESAKNKPFKASEHSCVIRIARGGFRDSVLNKGPNNKINEQLIQNEKILSNDKKYTIIADRENYLKQTMLHPQVIISAQNDNNNIIFNTVPCTGSKRGDVKVDENNRVDIFSLLDRKNIGQFGKTNSLVNVVNRFKVEKKLVDFVLLKPDDPIYDKLMPTFRNVWNETVDNNNNPTKIFNVEEDYLNLVRDYCVINSLEDGDIKEKAWEDWSSRYYLLKEIKEFTNKIKDE